MKKKEKYEAIVIIIVIILMPIIFFEEAKIKEENKQKLEKASLLIFIDYKEGHLAVDQIESRLDSAGYSKKEKSKILSFLREKGVSIDKDTNSTKDNEK